MKYTGILRFPKKPIFFVSFMNTPEYKAAMKDGSYLKAHKFPVIAHLLDFKYDFECKKVGTYYPNLLCGEKTGLFYGGVQPQSHDLRYPRKRITRAQAAIIHPELIAEIERIEAIITAKVKTHRKDIADIRKYNKSKGLDPNDGLEDLLKDE